MHLKGLSGEERRLQRILFLLTDLASESSRGVPFIVEGKKDVEALNELEIKGDLVAIKNDSRSLLDMLVQFEERGEDEVILLMDFDHQGRAMTKYLLEHLERMKIKTNIVIWKELSSLLRRDVKDIEGLPDYIETLKSKIGKAQNRI